MMAWFGIAAPLLWPWLLGALALGIAAGALGCASEGPAPAGRVVTALAALAVLACALVVGLALVPGRAGLWLELGLALLLAYGLGCGFGCLARRVARA